MKLPKQYKIEAACPKPVKSGTQPGTPNPVLYDGHLYATDGRIMARYPAAGPDGPIPLDAIKASRKTGLPVDLGAETAAVAGVTWARGETAGRPLTGESLARVAEAIDADRDGDHQIRLDGGLLVNLLTALGGEAVTLSVPDDPRQPVRVLGADASGLIMPIAK